MRGAAAQERFSSLQKRHGSYWRNQTFDLAVVNDRLWSRAAVAHCLIERLSSALSRS